MPLPSYHSHTMLFTARGIIGRAGASPPSRTTGTIFLIGASVSEPTLVVRKRDFSISRVIPQSSFYASFLISTHAQQRPVDVCIYTCVGRHCSVDEETHGVFGSCRRGRGATVEATYRKATT